MKSLFWQISDLFEKQKLPKTLIINIEFVYKLLPTYARNLEIISFMPLKI